MDTKADAVKLWLPQLTRDRRDVLRRLYDSIQEPKDVCPILPLSSAFPRFADELINHYRDEFEDVWQVDGRDLVYADEDNPLDLYRSLGRIDAARQRILNPVGGSLLVLSPMGNRAPAMGAVIAATENKFGILYAEAIDFAPNLSILDDSRTGEKDIIHLLLAGRAYHSGLAQG